MSAADLPHALAVIESTESLVARTARHLGATGGVDANQAVAYDLAHVSSGAAAARAMLPYATRGDLEAALACAFIADMAHDAASRVWGREQHWGLDDEPLRETRAFVSAHRAPARLAALSTTPGPRHLNDELEMVADVFRAFAGNEIAPHAEHVHRRNGDVPEEIIAGLAELGAFGLSIPSVFGGFSEGGADEYSAMVVATEELSRASLGIGGSLITRPEILARALLAGGTDAQKRQWLPRLASAEVLAAVAVTEPDFGSDVAGITVTATPAVGADGASGFVINGVKTWCTFAARADVLMLLARTNPDRSAGHRGLSVFVVPKPRGDAHGFVFEQEPLDGRARGRMEGRPIDTIGYRGMHSYEIALDDWWVASDHLIGETDGLGRGFSLQMAGFENGRLQTAARALGVMQAAYEAALDHASNRRVFGATVLDQPLTQAKLGRMAVLIQAGRQFAHHVARLMADGGGAAEASMAKAFVCRTAEWVTREAMQIHGGYGYAEEYAVSRYFVDARVLSIFEGADETLCLKVIARRLIEAHSSS